MSDTLTREQRHRVMSQIRSKNTSLEMVVRQYLHAHGFRYRLHVKDLPGNPDIVLPRYHAVVFVHGCFWHGHEGCKLFRIPKSNVDYWSAKIAQNIERDKKNMEKLGSLGWRIFTVWECQLREDLQSCCGELAAQIQRNEEEAAD